MRRVVFLVYPGFQLLDLSGAADVFSGIETRGTRPYQVVAASLPGGVVASGSGIAIQTEAMGGLGLGKSDTLIVTGAASEVRERAMADAGLRAALQDAARTAERVAAVCTGSFLLAAAGLLDHKQAVTHWASSAEFAAAFPSVTLLTEPVFAEDGGIWTSAATTTGIDMALDMVKRDYGNAPAHDVARMLRGARARARLRAQA